MSNTVDAVEVANALNGQDAPSFREIVERVTEALTAELNLPGYEEWVVAYRSDPARYDEELLGLWRNPL